MGNRTYWTGPLPPPNFADGTANATTTIADLSPGPQKFTNGLLELGTVIRLRARGEYTCGTTATTLTLGFYYGGAAGTALAGTTGTSLTVSQTSVPWWMEYEGEVRVLSTTVGSIKGMGILYLGGSLTSWVGTTDSPIPIPATAAARTVSTLDTISSKALTVAGNVSQTVGAPAVTCYSLSAELLG